MPGWKIHPTWDNSISLLLTNNITLYIFLYYRSLLISESAAKSSPCIIWSIMVARPLTFNPTVDYHHEYCNTSYRYCTNSAGRPATTKQAHAIITARMATPRRHHGPTSLCGLYCEPKLHLGPYRTRRDCGPATVDPQDLGRSRQSRRLPARAADASSEAARRWCPQTWSQAEVGEPNISRQHHARAAQKRKRGRPPKSSSSAHSKSSSPTE